MWINPLKKGGYLGFIIPHKFTNSEFGKGIRKYLSNRKLIHTFLSVGYNFVFEGVIIYTGIIIIEVEEYTRLRLGMKKYPKLHVFPQECRCRFENRNFDIDDYTVVLDPSRHEAIHPKVRLPPEQRKKLEKKEEKRVMMKFSKLVEKEYGKFPPEWNGAIMLELLKEEEKKASELDPDEILKIGESVMRRFRILRKFWKYDGEKKRGKCPQLKKYKP